MPKYFVNFFQALGYVRNKGKNDRYRKNNVASACNYSVWNKK